MFFTMCHIVCPIVQYQHGVYHRQAVAKTSYDCGPHSLALSLSDAIIASQFLQWQLTAAHIWSLFDDKQVGFEAAPKGCQETGVMSIVCIAAGRQFQLVGPLTARLHCPAILQVHDTYNMWAGVDCRCHWPDAVVIGVTSTLESLHVETLTSLCRTAILKMIHWRIRNQRRQVTGKSQSWLVLKSRLEHIWRFNLRPKSSQFGTPPFDL